MIFVNYRLFMTYVKYNKTTSASEDVTQLLDDHIVATQSMSFSVHKKPFEERIVTWESTLRTTQV